MIITRPKKGNKYYINKSTGGYNPCIIVSSQTDNNGIVDKDFNVLANCTAWTTGRFNELLANKGIISSNDGCKYLGNTNAKNQGLTISDTPVVGGVMCWDDGKYGHVEIVEEISLDGKICYNSSSAYATYILEKRTRKM